MTDTAHGTGATFDVDFGLRVSDSEPGFELQMKFASQHRRIAMFGASGAGKSLSLMAIAGLLRPARGRIVIDGRVLFDSTRGINLPARERRVGYLFQDYALFPHLNVLANVGFGLRRFGRPLDQAARSRVESLLQTFGLSGLRQAMPRHLSGGQRQRVALARAMAADPCALLLDEPFAALDIGLRIRMRSELLSRLQPLNLPVLMVTHDLQDVAALTEEVIRVESGRVTGSLLNTPANLHSLANPADPTDAV